MSLFRHPVSKLRDDVTKSLFNFYSYKRGLPLLSL